MIDGEEYYGTIISFDDEEGTVTIEDDESGEQVTGDQDSCSWSERWMADPLGALASASTAQCAVACLRLASFVAQNALPSMRERTWKNAKHPHNLRLPAPSTKPLLPLWRCWCRR